MNTGFRDLFLSNRNKNAAPAVMQEPQSEKD